jgi:hypothetical protein
MRRSSRIRENQVLDEEEDQSQGEVESNKFRMACKSFMFKYPGHELKKKEVIEHFQLFNRTKNPILSFYQSG